MKTLYISDLDGTLLNSDAELSRYTLETLNRLIASGLNFTVATARTEFTVRPILAGLELRLPVILNNGAALYDLAAKRYLDVKYIPLSSTRRILEHMRKLDVPATLYSAHGSSTTVYYEPERENAEMRKSRLHRVERFSKPFTAVERLESAADQHVMYLSCLNSLERLQPLSDALANVRGISHVLYRDNYTPDRCYLEVHSELGGKSNAVKALCKQLGAEWIVGFGDNLNDLPLFEACDVRCAVSNAQDALKRAADVTIGSNLDDAVARWLDANAELE